MSTFKRDDAAAAGSVIVFMVAGIIFIASVGAVLVATRQSAQGVAASTAPAAALNTQARGLAELLLDSPGVTAGATDWGATVTAGTTPLADSVTRLGLKQAGSSDATLLDFGKFQNLRLAPYAANSGDGYLNYMEARQGLGLANAGLDFHVRAYPTLDTVQHLLATGKRDPNLRIAYIGDITVSKTNGQPPPANPTQGLTVGTPACAVSPLPGAYRVSVPVTNGGNTTTQFNALVEYELGDGHGLSQNTNGFLVAPGGTTTLFVDVPATSGTSCARGSDLHFHVHDTGTNKVEAETELASGLSGASAAATDLFLDTGKPYFQNPTGSTTSCSDHVKLSYGGDSLPKSTGHDHYYVYLKVTNTAGTTSYYTASQEIPASGPQRAFDAGCLAAGEYLATLSYCGTAACTGGATTERVTENVLVTTGAVAGYSPTLPPPSSTTTYTPSTQALAEITDLNLLVDRFCPTYFDSQSKSPIDGQDWSTPPNGVGGDDNWEHRCKAFKDGLAQPGDVFPDSKDIMNNDLNARLLYPDDYANATLRGKPRYDLVNVLIAGSNVDQTAMTSSAAKDAVADWVLGGGTLLVFGSTAQNVNWLEPLFHAAIRSSSAGLGTPDPGHPLLHTSDELDYPHYSNGGRVWNFNGQTEKDAAQLFTNVVVQGQDAVTTLSNPGTFGSGRVLLTTWMPADPYLGARDPATTKAEGMRLIHNMLVEGYQDLFLDYGPPLPGHANVIPAVRFAQVDDPDFPDPVQLSLVVFVFPA